MIKLFKGKGQTLNDLAALLFSGASDVFKADHTLSSQPEGDDACIEELAVQIVATNEAAPLSKVTVYDARCWLAMCENAITPTTPEYLQLEELQRLGQLTLLRQLLGWLEPHA